MTQPAPDHSHVDPTSAVLIAGLAVQADKLAAAAVDLRQTYRFSRQLKVTLVVSFLLLTGIALIGLQNYANGRSRADAINIIKDCTSPGGECYQRSQDGTAKAVAQIVAAVNEHTDLVILAVVACERANTPLSLPCLKAHGITGANP